MLHIGIPAGLQFIFEVAAFDFSLVMMGWIGTKALAAHQSDGSEAREWARSSGPDGDQQNDAEKPS